MPEHEKFVFTCWDIDFKDNLLAIPCRWINFQEEECPSTGKHHYQGYMEFKTKLSYKFIHKNYLTTKKRCFLEAKSPKSTREQARDYCNKENTKIGKTFTKGIWVNGQGSRTDLLEVQKDIDNGMNKYDLSRKHFKTWVKFHKAFDKYSNLLPNAEKPRDFKTEVIVIVGTPGVGKSRSVWDECGNVHTMNKENNFWSSYNGEENVLWDDFDGSWIKRTTFLQLTDRYPTKIRQIGGWANWRPKKIYITSNDRPEDWYHKHKEAVLRRITTIKTVSTHNGN